MNIFEGTHIKLDLKCYPTSIFFFKGDKFQMYYNWETSVLWCRWDVLEKETICYKPGDVIKEQLKERFKVQDIHVGITSRASIKSIHAIFN